MSGDRESRLDAELADTFPASDPPSMTAPTAAGDALASSAEQQEDDVASDVVFLYRVVSRERAAKAFEPQPDYSADRWTSAGTPAIYASLSPAGALLEKLAHLGPGGPGELALAIGAMPADRLWTSFAAPAGWDAMPYRPEVQQRGDACLAAHEHLGTRVPSALVRREYNVLLDAAHPDLSSIVLIETLPLAVDQRLLGQGRD
jgi:RES domain-containing protein